MPLIDQELAGDDGGAAAVAVLQDIQEVVAGRGVERLEAPVVEDEEIDATERAQEAGVAAVAARQSQIAEQPWDALVEHRAIVAAGLVAERRRASSCQRRRARGSAGWRSCRSFELAPATLDMRASARGSLLPPLSRPP